MKEEKDNVSEEEYLSTYNAEAYEKPAVTVDMVIFTIDEQESRDTKRLPKKELKVLLIKRKEHPYMDSWCIPGGFVAIDESLEEAVNRKLKEETNIEDIYLEQLYTWGDINRDPRMRVISTSYMALVDRKKLSEKPGESVKELAWFRVTKEKDENIITLFNEEYKERIQYKIIDKDSNKLSENEEMDYKYMDNSTSKVAFDHIKIINYSLERMANKVKYTNIAFTLIPEKFTLSELQQVFEILLGEKLIKPNFRRWINRRVEETGEKKKEGCYRPSKMYKLKDDNEEYIL